MKLRYQARRARVINRMRWKILSYYFPSWPSTFGISLSCFSRVAIEERSRIAMKNAEIAGATSWRVSSFEDATRVAREIAASTRNFARLRVCDLTKSNSLRTLNFPGSAVKFLVAKDCKNETVGRSRGPSRYDSNRPVTNRRR